MSAGGSTLWLHRTGHHLPATTLRPTQEKAINFSVLETRVYFYQGQPDTENAWIDVPCREQ